MPLSAELSLLHSLAGAMPHIRRIRISATQLITVVVAAGMTLRLAAWLLNRSFWLDEVYLALNVTSRSFVELWQPLDHDQGAPIGFLHLAKLCHNLLGSSELALRVTPLLSGLAAMWLFARLAQRLLPAPAALLATTLFAFSPKLVHYSAEFKQYSSDVLVCVVLLLLASRHWTGARPASYRWLMFAGAAAIWFSHPAAFVLAGAGLVLFGVAFWRSDERGLRGLIGVGITWIASFLVCYAVCLRELSANRYLLDYWSEWFAPVPPRQLDQLGWYLRALCGLFEVPAGMVVADVSFAVPAAMLFAFGWWWLWRRQPALAASLIAPLVLALLASMAQRYPFGGRLLLFAVPLLHLGIAAAIAESLWSRPTASRNFMLALGAVVVLAPLATTLQEIIRPRSAEDHRAAVGHVCAHWQTGDVLLLSDMARQPWRYYSQPAGIEPSQWSHVRRNDWDSVRAAVQNVTGRKRVWLLIAHERDANRKMLLWQMDQHGRQLDRRIYPGAEAYLYDMSPTDRR